MLPVDFPERNYVFEKPSSWTDEQCFELPVWKGISRDESGHEAPVIISFWRLSKEDFDEIQKSGGLYLSIVGTGMPPVSLFTENPFNQDPQ